MSFSKVSKDLELDKVLSDVARHSLSERGAESVRRSRPVWKRDKYLERQRLVREMRNAVSAARDMGFYAESFPPLSPVFDYLKKQPSSPLDGAALCDIARFIHSAESLRRVLSAPHVTGEALSRDQGKKLDDVFPAVDASLALLGKEIPDVVGEDGEVRETYPTLRELIKKAERMRARRADFARDYIGKNISVVNSDAAVLRSGRLLIPVKREMHGQVDGIVQSVSQTGATVFMEPYTLAKINNEVEMAFQEIQIEKTRLLSRLTQSVRDHLTGLKALESRLEEADWLYSFASWAEAWKCVPVLLSVWSAPESGRGGADTRADALGDVKHRRQHVRDDGSGADACVGAAGDQVSAGSQQHQARRDASAGAAVDAFGIQRDGAACQTSPRDDASGNLSGTAGDARQAALYSDKSIAACSTDSRDASSGADASVGAARDVFGIQRDGAACQPSPRDDASEGGAEAILRSEKNAEEICKGEPSRVAESGQGQEKEPNQRQDFDTEYETGNPDFSINLIQARHPLLREHCVPVDIRVPSGCRAVVVSGPNAGGKTVTIKTVALFSLLNQICGHAPLLEGSSLPIFDRVFTDIGDEQSIEAGLSTFSAHLKEQSSILKELTPSSLVVFDELGSGTDPAEGAALARAVLEYSMSHAGITFVTSHYGVLKHYAYAAGGVLNASMEFNEKTGKPTFRLISGESGESYAIETARRMGLPRQVVASARKYLGREAVKISSIIRSLEEKRREADEKGKVLSGKLKELDAKNKDLEEKLRFLDVYQAGLKGDLYAKYEGFVRSERSRLENLVRELREGEITREKTARVKAETRRLGEVLEERREEVLREKEAVMNAEMSKMEASPENVVLEAGMDVLCGKNKREGTILGAAGRGLWNVAIGSMRFTLKESELTVPAGRRASGGMLGGVSGPVSRHGTRGSSSVGGSHEGAAGITAVGASYTLDESLGGIHARLVLDVRGFRLEEALSAMDDEIEACILRGVREFSVIHGYGEGVLLRGIREYLNRNNLVESFSSALPEDGGGGKTYVRLK